MRLVHCGLTRPEDHAREARSSDRSPSLASGSRCEGGGTTVLRVRPSSRPYAAISYDAAAHAVPSICCALFLPRDDFRRVGGLGTIRMLVPNLALDSLTRGVQ